VISGTQQDNTLVCGGRMIWMRKRKPLSLDTTNELQLFRSEVPVDEGEDREAIEAEAGG